MDQRSSQNKKIIGLIIGLVLLVIAIVALFSYHKIGKTEVLFTVIPKDSTIEINGNSSTDKTRHLLPGKYTATISRKGFETVKEQVAVTNDPLEYGSALPGDSDISRQYYEDNPEEEELLDGIGGLVSARFSDELGRKYPIVNKLPVREVEKYFAIDYGIEESSGDVFLLIRNSSTEGRTNAVKWLQENGADISMLDVRYDDYVSPLKDRKTSERGY